MMSFLIEQLINITDALFLGHVGEIELGLSRKSMGISKKICDTEKEELPVSHTSEISTEELYFSVE